VPFESSIRHHLRPVWAAIILLAVTTVVAVSLTSVGIARYTAAARHDLCVETNENAVAIRDAVDKLVPDRSSLEPDTRKAFAHLIEELTPEPCP
jgi:hypothetical protein